MTIAFINIWIMTRRRETSDFSSSFPKYVCARPPKRVSIRAKWTNSRISLPPLSSLSENVSFGNAKIDIRDEQTLGMHFDFTSRQPFVYFQSKRSSQNLLQLQRRGENIQKGQIMLLVRSLKVCDSSESICDCHVYFINVLLQKPSPIVSRLEGQGSSKKVRTKNSSFM